MKPPVIKALCDRCKKELTKDERARLYTWAEGHKYIVHRTPSADLWGRKKASNKYDLCNECLSSIEDALNFIMANRNVRVAKEEEYQALEKSRADLQTDKYSSNLKIAALEKKLEYAKRHPLHECLDCLDKNLDAILGPTVGEQADNATYPTYNHTRGDSPATPCNRCKELEQRQADLKSPTQGCCQDMAGGCEVTGFGMNPKDCGMKDKKPKKK